MAFLWGVYGAALLAGFLLMAAGLAVESNRRFFSYLALVPLVLVIAGYSESAVILLLLLVLFAWSLFHPEQYLEPEKTAWLEDLPQLRITARDDPELRYACVHQIATIYEAIEEPELALKYYRQALELRRTHNLEFKVRLLEKEDGSWRPPTTTLAYALRACPRCELITSRFGYSCQHCGQFLYPDLRSWIAVSFNRWYEKMRIGNAALPGAVFLPFLFIFGPVLYGLVWAVWAVGLRGKGIL